MNSSISNYICVVIVLLFAVNKKFLMYGDANVDLRDANAIMSQKLMNRKLNKNGADNLAPEMASGQEVKTKHVLEGEAIWKTRGVSWMRGCVWPGFGQI